MNTAPITREFLAAARGDAPGDLLLAGGRLVNVFTRTISAADVLISGGRIAAVVPPGEPAHAEETIALGGSYVAPGFIDAHMHVESTMMPPSEFAKLAVPHGTTGAVFDPHEIANVLGVAGIRFLMDNAEGLPLHAMWAVSSCVPSSPLETSGAELSAADLAPLLDDDRVVALAEMMNFPGVLNGDPGVLEKINLGLRRRVIDGHSPGLRGRALQAYIAAGISSDHECTSAEEAREKLALGMRIFIREGSAARNLRALLPLVTAENAHRFCFCTDDRHPADLKEQGHIDHVVRGAVAAGLDPVLAITMGSFNAAHHYRRRDLGAVAPGYWADLIVFDDTSEINPRLVFHRGRLVAEDGRYAGPAGAIIGAPRAPVRVPADLSAESFRIPARRAAGRIRVIGIDPHQLVTEQIITDAHVQGGRYIADSDRDILKLAVIERHRGTGNIGRGFVRGFGFRGGALGSTVGHDSHNLAVVGDNDGDMFVAAGALARAGGGQCVVGGGRVLALLPLPIAGLMSDQPAETVIRLQAKLLGAARSLGCPHEDPFMPLSFLPLPVIPRLKLTDLGLVDVERFEVVGLEA